MKNLTRRLLLAAMAVTSISIGLFVTLIGPWPAYSAPADVTATSQYQAAREMIARQPAPDTPGPLQAGWGKVELAFPEGTPLAGFGNRKGAPSTGTHDPLHIKALALSDGFETAVICGSDILIVPENVAEKVRAIFAANGRVNPGAILFNASHTHSGPGAFAPGLLCKLFAGEYDPRIPEILIMAFEEAITHALDDIRPASIASGMADAPDGLRNRARDAGVDSSLDYLAVRGADGAICHVVRYSAHATVISSNNMTFSADYPGALQRAIEARTGGMALFLAGGMGGMSPRAPEAPDAFARAEALGAMLAGRVLESAESAPYTDRTVIRTIGVPLQLPPFQLRLNNYLRVSPLLFPLTGLDTDGWLQGVRIGEAIIAGMPADFSGEIAAELAAWGREQGVSLWVTSFNGDYAGYISPDRYYEPASWSRKDNYEMMVMSWCGPAQERFFTGLCKEMVLALDGGM